MTETWWRCRTCADDFFSSPAVHTHRLETGHVGAALMTDDVPPPSTSTPEARRAALDAAAQAVRDAKARGGR